MNTATTFPTPNRYPATCVRCNARIPAEAGLLARTDDGRWAANHDGDCPEKPMHVAAPAVHVNTAGTYKTPDGTTYKVREDDTGRLYAERLEPETNRYAPAAGIVHTLRPEWRI